MDSNHHLQTRNLVCYQLHHEAMFAETKGFEPLRRFRLPVFRTGAINQLCQISDFVTRERFELPTPTFVASCSDPIELTSLISGSKRIRTSGTSWFNTLAVCRFRPLSHTSLLISDAKLRGPNEVFFRSKKKLHLFICFLFLQHIIMYCMSMDNLCFKHPQYFSQTFF